MQHEHSHPVIVMLLLGLLLSPTAPALAQSGEPQASACAPLSTEELATYARLAERKQAGQLVGAARDLFLKLREHDVCTTAVAQPAAVDAVSTYGFVQFAGAYTTITGGTVHATGSSIDWQNYNAVDIGFTFVYDGVPYTQVGINADGFVRMGGADFQFECNSEPISSGSTTNCANLVSALGTNLKGRDDAELRSETTGAAPNRVFTVQWKNFRHYDIAADRYNFQIKLYETSNQVAFVYGPFVKNTTVVTPQVGLKGATNADFNNRTGTNWAASTAGTSNSATMSLADAYVPRVPAAGQTYTWLALADDAGVTAITAPVSGCFLGSAETVTIMIKNFGASTQTSIPVAYRANGGAWVNETWTGSLAPFATASYTFAAPLDLSAPGAYTIDARTDLAGDENPNNDQSSKLVVAGAISSFPYTESFEGGPAGWHSGGDNSSWELGTPNDTVIQGAYHGTQAWTTGLTADYHPWEESYVASVCFNFSGLAAPSISLGVWWQTEYQWDGANLQYTTDGATWHTVGEFGDAGNWYNSNSITFLDWTGSEHGWTGRVSSGNGSGGWLLAEHGLGMLAGAANVQFRIAFGADDKNHDDGFAFDQVRIFEDAAVPGCALLGSPPNGATDVPTDTDLVWSAGAGTPTSYDVHFGVSPSPPFVTNTASRRYDPDSLALDTTYYWQIVPKNAYGSATGCPVWSFTTWGDPTVSVFPYSEDFDGVTAPALPTGWTHENSNGDSEQWETVDWYRRGIGGYGARVSYNSTLAMNDWLFTPPLQLTAGMTYGVRFFYRAGLANYPEKLEVKWGASNSSAGMTQGPIFDDPNINFTVMKEAIATFTPPADGVYYVGFHGYSAADQLSLVLDDVTIYDTADSLWQWQGNASNDWFANGNWEGGIVPGELDQVLIPATTASASALSPQASSPFIGASGEASYGRVKDLTIASGATLELASTHNQRVEGTMTNNGTLRQNRPVNTVGSAVAFMNIKNVAGAADKYFGVGIKPTSSALGDVTVAVQGNQKCPAGTLAMLWRCYDVTPATPAAADITFYFTQAELAPSGYPLTEQQVWNYHGGSWHKETRGADSGACNPGDIGCWVTGTGISVYSPFALGPEGPNAVTLASFAAAAAAPWPAGLVALLALAALIAIAGRRNSREHR